MTAPTPNPDAVEAAVLACVRHSLPTESFEREDFTDQAWTEHVGAMSAAIAAYLAKANPWHRLPDVQPPRDGTLFEVRLDDRPGRYFASLTVVNGADGERLLLSFGRVCADGIWRSWPDLGRDFPGRAEAWLSQPGWWRLLPPDGPPAEAGGGT